MQIFGQTEILGWGLLLLTLFGNFNKVLWTKA